VAFQQLNCHSQSLLAWLKIATVNLQYAHTQKTLKPNYRWPMRDVSFALLGASALDGQPASRLEALARMVT
jgi:hypothetical protein